MRNALAHAGKSGRQVVSALIASAFAQADAGAARQQWRRVADQFHAKTPKLSAIIDLEEKDVLAYRTPPSAHRTKINAPNRLSARTEGSSAGQMLSASSPVKPPIKRLVGAILLEQNDEWQPQHHDMTLETVVVRTDEQPTALTHIAA